MPKNKIIVEKERPLFNRILYEMDFLVVRMLTLLSALSGFVPVFYNGFVIGCQLMFFQNVLMPALITALFLSAMKKFGRIERLKSGLMIGAIVGAIPALISVVVNNMQYYFFGVREAEIAARGGIVGPVTLTSLLYVLASQILAFIFLTGLSGLMGIIASQLPSNQGKPLS